MDYLIDVKKNVSIDGRDVITDWRETRLVSPENLQEKVKANEDAKEEVKKQKEITPISSNSTATLN